MAGGTEFLAGVVQGGDATCTSAAFTRVDLNISFIDQWIDAFDPPPDAGASESSDASDEAEAASTGDAASEEEAGQDVPIGDAALASLETAPPIGISGRGCACALTANPCEGGLDVWAFAGCLAAVLARRHRRASRRITLH